MAAIVAMLVCQAATAQHGTPAPPPTTKGIDPNTWLHAVVTAMEAAHGISTEREQQPHGFRARLRIKPADSCMPPIEADVICAFREHRLQAAFDTGATVTLMGDDVWIEPADSEFNEPRSTVVTLFYFLTMPYRFRDSDIWIGARGLRRVAERNYAATFVSFSRDRELGPLHWYAPFVDPHTDRLLVLAYYANLDGRDVHPDRDDQHVIVFEAFTEVDGHLLPSKWRRHLWSRVDGIRGDAIETVVLSDHAWVSVDETAFVRPEDARQVPNPIREKVKAAQREEASDSNSVDSEPGN